MKSTRLARQMARNLSDKTMSEKTKKPDWARLRFSQVVRAMVNGLKRYGDDPDFEIRMATYGAVQRTLEGREICMGCAATCAIQELAGVRFTPDDIEIVTGLSAENAFYNHATATGWPIEEVDIFENAVDALRGGNYFIHQAVRQLQRLGCQFSAASIVEEMSKLAPLLELNDTSWREHLPAYEKFAERLEAVGL